MGGYFMEFKDRLKELRESKGLTQKELADELIKFSTRTGNNSKIYTQTISYWENGRDPSLEMLVIIAKYFDVPTDYLLGKTDFINIDEINFEYFSKYLSKQNIENLIKEYPKNIQKSIYFLLTNYTCDIFTNFNGEKKSHGINIDFLYIITKTADILKSFYEEVENKIIYNDSGSKQIKYKDHIPCSTIKKINNLKLLTSMRLNLILDELEELAVNSNASNEIQFKDKILEYSGTYSINKNNFSKYIKKDFTKLIDDVVDNLREFSNNTDIIR